MPSNIHKGIKALAKVALIDRRGPTPDGELIIYHLFEDLAGDADERALDEAGVRYKRWLLDGQHHLLLYREKSQAKSRLPWVNIGLLLATVITTLMAGAMMAGVNPLEQPLALTAGWPFSLTLLAILGTHELGHYVFARRHKVEVSLPYFIPVPPPITFLGTFGAFIRMRGPIPNRVALLEIGAAGPIAGFLVAVPALFYGLDLSEIVQLNGGEFLLGESLIMKGATRLVFPGLEPGQDILLHPVAFAAWIGLLVTMLNLLPLAQLDGGHITYALLGDRQTKVAKVMFAILVIMGIFLAPQWLFWAVLVLLLMRSLSHPPVPGIHLPLNPHEIRIGVICLVIFILCFMPVPFSAG